MANNGPSDDGSIQHGQAQKLFCFNGGFFRQKQVRRILALSGYPVTFGRPGPDDLIGVWGKSPTSGRGDAIARTTQSRLVYIEDAFLRSIQPGRTGEPPLGLCIDHGRPHFDSSHPSDLETLLATHPLDNTHMLNRAKDAIARIKALELSKYSATDHRHTPPEPGYVLVIDQTKEDASIPYSGASPAHFREMLVFAQEEHPKARIFIRQHPETQAGYREGHFGPEDETERLKFLDARIPVHALLEGAIAVYTVSSGFGFDAILSGHKPHVFGQPFYTGWGLSDDRMPVARRQRTLTRAQLFAAAMMLYPKWYDPYRDQLCEIETIIDTLEAQRRAYLQDQHGHIATGMTLWKHAPLRRIFGAKHYGAQAKLRFIRDPQKALSRAAPGSSVLIWASAEPEGYAKAAQARGITLRRLEDGFLRSRGLGADLVAPLSLVTDPQGIYYDPTRPSQLETLIAASSTLPRHKIDRAERLRQMIIRHGISKYNLAPSPQAQPGLLDLKNISQEKILVTGQVEDDRSVLKGTREITGTDSLLHAVRRDFPDAYLIYKPHPDVEAGLRAGCLDSPLADLVLRHADPILLLEQIDRVCTMTSLLGFEALLRGRTVTCYGAPFYAGWGLTEDCEKTPPRRAAPVPLEGLVHACLIDYPRYFDPLTGLPCPPEVVVERLTHPPLVPPFSRRVGLNRIWAKLRGRWH